nr:reverse transcriptase domain-containing protein [Tanacetum cinerariifolium]
MQQNQVVPLSELEKIKRMNEINIKAMQTQINNVKNELRNEINTSIQASMSNQTNKLKNMMASFFQMNTPSTLGLRPLPSNTIANPKGELKAITTRSGLVLDGPSVPIPPPFINPEEDERVEETLMDPELCEFTIKVPHPLIQKAKPPSQRNYVKILKALFFNKEKLLELTNTPLNENCLAIILKKLPEKLGDPGKFLILCGFSELKCKALADLGMDFILEDSINEDNLANPIDNLFDAIPEMFNDEHTLDYSSPLLYDDYDDDLFELESDNDDAYNDPFESKEEKINESKLLIDELDLPRSSDLLPSPEYDSFLFEDFSEVDALPSTNNEDKVFNLGILIHENLSEVTVQVMPDKNVKKISISHASLILEDFDPPLYELPFHKKVLGALKLSKSLKFLKARWRFFLALMERTSVSWMFRVSIFIPHEQFNSGLGQAKISRIVKTRARGFVLRSLDLRILSFILGIQYPNLID